MFLATTDAEHSLCIFRYTACTSYNANLEFVLGSALRILGTSKRRRRSRIRRTWIRRTRIRRTGTSTRFCQEILNRDANGGGNVVGSSHVVEIRARRITGNRCNGGDIVGILRVASAPAKITRGEVAGRKVDFGRIRGLYFQGRTARITTRFAAATSPLCDFRATSAVITANMGRHFVIQLHAAHLLVEMIGSQLKAILGAVNAIATIAQATKVSDTLAVNQRN